jgi:hypothetical protein
MKDKIKEISDTISAELCKRVNAPYPPPDTIKYNTDDYSWTQEEEDDFAKWLFSYLVTKQPFKRLGKKRTRREVDWIIFQFAWTTRGAK